MPGGVLDRRPRGYQYPQLFGNGKDMAHEAFLGVGGIGLLFALFALKPLVTALTLGSGAAGGVFTPFLATGALSGAFPRRVVDPPVAGHPIGRLRRSWERRP